MKTNLFNESRIHVVWANKWKYFSKEKQILNEFCIIFEEDRLQIQIQIQMNKFWNKF